MKNSIMILVFAVSISGCASMYPDQSANFSPTTITVNGGRMLRDYVASETVNEDNSVTRSFSSTIPSIFPESMPLVIK